MTSKDIKYLFRNYNRYKKTIKDLQEQVEFYRTQAEKITPSYSDSGGGSPGSSSKVENNVIKYEHILENIKKLELLVDQAEFYLTKLKSYQRHIITLCLVKNIPYESAANKEHTSTENIKKIIDNAIRSLAD